MPKYTLPEPKKPKKGKDYPVAVGGSDEWRRHITIPVNKEILDALDVGDSVTVTLEGTVNQLAKHESTDHKDMNVGMEIKSVECYSTGNGKAEKQFSKGYKKARSDK